MERLFDPQRMLRITVSPFDGANRIRFKGSPVRIADCEMRISDLKRSHFNPQSEITNPKFLGTLSREAPPKVMQTYQRNAFDSRALWPHVQCRDLHATI